MATTKYLPASLDGAAFAVVSTDDEGLGAARTVLHTFPGAREPYAEENGNFEERFEIDCLLLTRPGDTATSNFETRLDALEKVLKKTGPWKLVHPHRGTKLVVLDGPPRVRRHTLELGGVRVALQLVVAANDVAPVLPRDTRVDIKRYAKAARDMSLPRKFNVEGPDFLQELAELICAGPEGLTNELRRVNDRIQSGFDVVNRLGASITALSNQISELLNTPNELATAIHGLIADIMSFIEALPFADERSNGGDKPRNFARTGAALTITKQLGTFGAGFAEVRGTTATAERERTNQSELFDVIEVASLSAGLEAMSRLPFDTTDQGAEAMLAVDATIKHIIDRGSIASECKQGLRALRAAFHKHLSSTISDTTGIGRFTPNQTQPAFLIAWELYGDISRAQEIVERNRIEHPGFIPGGLELSVPGA